jgi:hypothetical protein
MRALELAERLRRRDVTSVELTEQAIATIRARDGRAPRVLRRSRRSR